MDMETDAQRFFQSLMQDDPHKSMPGVLLSRECKTTHPLKGKLRYNGNSSAVWVYTFIFVVISIIYFLISSIFISL